VLIALAGAGAAQKLDIVRSCASIVAREAGSSRWQSATD